MEEKITPETEVLSEKKTQGPKKSKKKKSKKNTNGELKRGPGRKTRPYPLIAFELCFEFAKSVHEIGSGQKVRRLTLFDKIGKAPESSTSRILQTNTSKYGLISGSIVSEFIELEPKAVKIFSEDATE
jgi:hypothetical protein